MTNGNHDAFASAAMTDDGTMTGEPGLNKREYFAAVAMQGMMSRDAFDPGQQTPLQRARLACIEAAALIEALNEPTCPYCKLSNVDKHYDAEHQICPNYERAWSEAQ
jgi:hypothetical protein